MRAVFATMVLAAMLLVTGCSAAAHLTEESDVLMWQQAKAEAQAMEREIASQLPAEVVVSVDQSPTGTLISCKRGNHSWFGGTTVTVVEGTGVEALVRGIEAYFSETSYDTGHRLDVRGFYEARVTDERIGASVRVSEGFEPTQISISSSSACFTLPEGTYPRGEF